VEVVGIVRAETARYKILSAGIVTLLLLAINIPVHTVTGTDKTTKYTVIFHDDFDDNIKNTTLWTEVFADGEWEEKNQRVEFELVENDSYLEEGIESIPFNVTFSSEKGLQINWTIITDIGSTSSVGTVRLRVIDNSGNNWIDAQYWRYHHLFRYKDSIDNKYYTLKKNVPEGIWDNSLTIYGDRYRLTMGGIDTGWINKTIFPEYAQIKIQIFITNAGSTHGCIQRSAFDNVTVSLIEEEIPSPIDIKWTYPSSNIFERRMHYPYEVKLNVSAGALPDGEENFTFGLDYNFTPYNLLGEKVQPEWELNENSICILSNSSHSQFYNFGTILDTTITSNETKEWNFIIFNRWNWIEPWNMGRILSIVYSIITSCSGTVYPELSFYLSANNYAGYASIVSQFINAIWHLKYSYSGLGNSSQSSPGSVDVWINPEKLALLVESIISAELASKFTSLGFSALLAPLVGWNVAASLFIAEAVMWVVSEITYLASVDPDYNFTQLARPEIWYLPIVRNITDPLARNLTLTSFEVLSIAETRKISYSRFLGAVEKGDIKWASIQLAATRYYTQMEKELIQKLQSDFEEITPILPPMSHEVIDEIGEYLETEGLPEIEIDAMKQLGFTNDDLNALLDFYLSVNDTFYLDSMNISHLMENLSSMIDTANYLMPATISDDAIIATIDIEPSIMDANSPTDNICCYVEFNDTLATMGWQLLSAKLNGIVDAVYISDEIGDHDNDGIPDTLVRFNTGDIIPLLDEGGNPIRISGNVSFPSSGEKRYYGIAMLSLKGSPPATQLHIGKPRYLEWVKSSTPIWLNATDDISGVKYTICEIRDTDNKLLRTIFVEDNDELDTNPSSGTISVTFNMGREGIYDVLWYSIDGAGNIEEINTQEIIVDDSPPSTALRIGKPRYMEGIDVWISPQTPIYLNATDGPEFGCGVKEIHYSYDGGDTWHTARGNNVAFTIREECQHLLLWYAVDHLGNTEKMHSFIVNVDAFPPSTNLTVGEPHTENPLFVKSLTPFQFISSDTGNCTTGVKAKWYRIWSIYGGWTDWMMFHPLVSITGGIPIVHGEGLHYIEFYSEDFVGNIEDTHNITCYVDDTPPKSRAYCMYPRYIYIEAEDIGRGELMPAVGGCRIHYRYKVGNENWTEWNVSENGVVIIHLTWPDNVFPVDKPIHVEYYAVDALGNKEDLHHDTFTIESNKKT